MASLAKEYGVRRSTISIVLHRFGIPLRKPRQLGLRDLHTATRLYQQGWSLVRIGEKLAFDAETIRTHLKRHGVVMRGPNDPRHR